MIYTHVLNHGGEGCGVRSISSVRTQGAGEVIGGDALQALAYYRVPHVAAASRRGPDDKS